MGQSLISGLVPVCRTVCAYQSLEDWPVYLVGFFGTVSPRLESKRARLGLGGEDGGKRRRRKRRSLDSGERVEWPATTGNTFGWACRNRMRRDGLSRRGDRLTASTPPWP